jgi:SAM-dependent methyltransferase
MRSLTESETYWRGSQAEIGRHPLPVDDPLRQWIRRWTPPGARSVLEVGCVPGRFLQVFGELGLQLNGVDLLDDVIDGTPQRLQSQGMDVSVFQRVDFFEFQTPESFDVVASFGFIEHFEPWEPAFRRHLELVGPGGTVMITTPNFTSPLQHFVQRRCNPIRFRGHNLEAMHPDRWADLAAACGFDVIFAGPIGRAHYWVNDQPRALANKVLTHVMIDLVLPLLRALPVVRDHRFLAPHCGLVARAR